LSSAQLEWFISQAVGQPPVLAIMIGEIANPALSTAELIRLIHQTHPKIPLLLQRDSAFIRNELDESSQPWIIQLPDKPDYQSLLRLLDYARQLIGLKPMQTKSKIISPQGTPLFRTLVGESPQISEVRELMQQVSKRKANVLLLGESGTGKEIVARNIH